MTRIIVDDMLRSKLHNLLKPLELVDESGRVLGSFVPVPLELCDESGRVLGRFVPKDDMSDVVDMSDWEPVTPDVSEEELDRREQSTEWYTTEQVLDHLRNLEKQ